MQIPDGAVLADGVLTVAVDRLAQVLPGLAGLAGDDEVRVVLVLADSTRHPSLDPVMAGPTRNPSIDPVIAGSTRNPSPGSDDRATDGKIPDEPGAGDGCRVEPGMTMDRVEPGMTTGAGTDGCLGDPGMAPSTLLRALPQPVVAMAGGTCEAATVAVLAASDIVFAAHDARFVVIDGTVVDAREAEARGIVTCTFPAADLERETQALARDLAAKDPLALRLTKETLAEVGAIAWDAVLDYNAAKVAQLKELQAGRPSSRAAGVASFLAGKSKPGLGS
ncbi:MULTISPECIES: hypothetical protein [Ramlibacter]|uniref:Enoyl-CoA hydratase/isomerase family protein n=1 Tax=Ramlibacter pinisoli TaxID=2682844 RepID=A0A6N8IW62_9BURK|nr:MULTISPECIES: hypothetical protein [Ramlibacter]MBA2961084.1 hypothetical protein [Ramlibacter sp. CGMCC 1.13660]MVQ31028.1 hypothetical protein [Ramlibacter pinisoli]